jgi:hypothetical protein
MGAQGRDRIPRRSAWLSALRLPTFATSSGTIASPCQPRFVALARARSRGNPARTDVTDEIRLMYRVFSEHAKEQ